MVMRFRLTLTLPSSDDEVFHAVSDEKSSLRKTSPKPGKRTGVDVAAWITRRVDVEVGRNHWIVAVGGAVDVEVAGAISG